jgi:hypothetical protein
MHYSALPRRLPMAWLDPCWRSARSVCSTNPPRVVLGTFCRLSVLSPSTCECWSSSKCLWHGTVVAATDHHCHRAAEKYLRLDFACSMPRRVRLLTHCSLSIQYTDRLPPGVGMRFWSGYADVVLLHPSVRTSIFPFARRAMSGRLTVAIKPPDGKQAIDEHDCEEADFT